jgi:hypothetical protein
MVPARNKRQGKPNSCKGLLPDAPLCRATQIAVPGSVLAENEPRRQGKCAATIARPASMKLQAGPSCPVLWVQTSAPSSSMNS